MESELERLRKKVENFPSASLYNRLAELARTSGSDEEAENVCRRCIKEFPRNGQAYVILAEIELARGKRQDAFQLLHTGIERDPRSYGGHKILSDILVENDDIPGALRHLKQILAFKPNDSAITTRIADLEKKHGVKAASGAHAVLKSTIGNEPLEPFQGPLTTAVKAATSSRGASLDGLCGEIGVRGALVADVHGRVVLTKNLPSGQDELLAALAAEIAKTTQSALTTMGADRLSTWVIGGSAGQVLTFQRDRAFSVVVLADVTVRPAMLELRARQTLIDLGAA
ncbi:MAG: roadblock/LC7 domain-containing protein [Planctomycetes bacterium]|nr:roadblock/LC7 domain-containing protein [Planctomycetota bacterium]